MVLRTLILTVHKLLRSFGKNAPPIWFLADRSHIFAHRNLGHAVFLVSLRDTIFLWLYIVPRPWVITVVFHFFHLPSPEGTISYLPSVLKSSERSDHPVLLCFFLFLLFCAL